MSCFFICYGLPLGNSIFAKPCATMCDHVLVNVYILLFAAKYVKHKLTHKRYLLYTPRKF